MVLKADVERGRLIVLEGVDGCGKSTQAKRLASSLGALLTSEPGATAVGAKLRALLLDPEEQALSVRTEALLMAADRAEHVAQMLEPALASGSWVVCDRFTASTLAYQGFGRQVDLSELRPVASFASGALKPDLQVLLDVSIDVARTRMRTSSADRLEHLGDDFFDRVREGYLTMASSDPVHWVVVDGEEDVDIVEHDVFEVVTARLGKPPAVFRT